MKLPRLLAVLAAVAGLAGCGSGAGHSGASTSIPAVPSASVSAAPSASASGSPTAAASPSAGASMSAAAPSMSAASPSATAAYVPVTLRTTEQKSTDASLLLDIDTVTVTGVDGVPTTTGQAITRALNDAAQTFVTGVRGKDKKPTGANPHNSITNVASVVEADDRYVTVSLTSEIYGSGAAHPNAALIYLTFQRATGALFSLTHNAALLTRLQTQTRTLLPAVIGTHSDPDSIKRGTTAENLTLAHIFPRTDGLEVLFDAYQVASYAQGNVYVVVPWSALSGVVASDVIPTSAAPAPAMRGGTASAGFESSNLSPTIASSTLPALAGIGDFTVVDPTYAQPPNGTTGFLLVQVVPTAHPSQDVTVSLKISEAATETYTVDAAGHDSTICNDLDTSIVAMTAIAC